MEHMYLLTSFRNIDMLPDIYYWLTARTGVGAPLKLNSEANKQVNKHWLQAAGYAAILGIESIKMSYV